MRQKIKGFVIHCSAGFGDIVAVQRFWRLDLKWKNKGYAVFIETNGRAWYLSNNTAVQGYSTTYNSSCFEFITNGVAGYNQEYVHICYQGGVERVGNKLVAKNTMTVEQQITMSEVIRLGMAYFNQQRKFDLTMDFGVWGHFDFSPDKDGTGVIESWERIKECPSFPVMATDFHRKFSSLDRIGTLPYNRPRFITNQTNTRTHVVTAGQSLWSISRQYNITVDALRRKNNLTTDVLAIGQILVL